METDTRIKIHPLGDFTPEFTAYALANGRRPADQLQHDKEEFPGGRMAGFMTWMSTALREFKRKFPQYCAGDSIRDHGAKQTFLAYYAINQRAEATTAAESKAIFG